MMNRNPKPRKPGRFRQREAARLMRAAVDAGVPVSRIELDDNGKVSLIVGKPGDAPAGDDVDKEIENFRKEHGYS